MIASFLIAILFQLAPAVVWEASVDRAESDRTELVLKAKIAQGYYIHPMSDKAIGVSLELADGLVPAGEPVEQYEPADYKGLEVVTGEYVLRQAVDPKGADAIKGTVTWSACHGDECEAPEDYDFAVKIPDQVGNDGSVMVGNDGSVMVGNDGTVMVGNDGTVMVGNDGSVMVGNDGTVMADPDRPSLWSLILEAILWGLLMLLTPCVFPMVPMTVSFFLRQSGSQRQGRLKAAMYGLFIVLLYTVPISVIIGLTWAVGGSAVTADIFNWLSTHWLPNIIFFLVFMVFAASFFGAFEIVLPSSWANKADAGSNRKGLLGVFFLALTLVLVSFSCTGPIVGTVLIKSTQGEFWAPMVTMLAFSIAFALPFTLFAFFPTVLSKLPRSGGWLNSVKIVLGFIEIALGLKFLSVADQTYHWHILDRDIYLAIWIICFTLLGLYLLGVIKFKYDTPIKKYTVGRIALVVIDFAFVAYLITGFCGAPLKAISGYLPPMETQHIRIGKYAPAAGETGVLPETALAGSDHLVALPHGLTGYDNLDAGLEAAAAAGKKVFVDITGHGCVNCREMEARVWSKPEVLERLRDNFVIVSLYVDDKTRLPEDQWVTTPEGRVLKDVGRVNARLVLDRFGVNSQPNYFILAPDGTILAGPRGYNLDPAAFARFLDLE
ncbi:MAG: thioredoxin family protein [Bacteroidales bacterium]|nr:thioredoxin family protein [Bacteroidales bacterium]